MSDQFKEKTEISRGQFEAEAHNLAGEVEKYRNSSETGGLPTKEIVRKALHDLTGHPLPSSFGQVSEEQEGSHYLDAVPVGQKREVEHFLNLVDKEGVVKVVEEVRKSSPNILDAFHAALTHKFYDHFRERGVFK
mgnify:CR=1 FL=1